MLPLIYGCVERRPGTYYITSAYGAAQIVRMIPFIYSSEIAYELEFGNLFIRVLYDDEVIETISSPYKIDDLFQIQYKQVGDVMWLVHPSYKQRKLTRTSATTFSLDVISFTKGPFLTRNDLIDPDETDASTMSCTAIAVGATGTLTCTGEIFDALHVGALFKLIHPRVTTKISQSGAGTSSTLSDVKGTCSFVTTGTWKGTVILQRRENSTSDNDWEDYRTYEALTSGARNDSLSFVEDADNVQYRIYAVAGMSANFGATLTNNNPTQEGIIRINSINTELSAEVTVLTALASINATKRWAEGCWSDYRGYPSSITFMDGRCIYGGASVIAEQIVEAPE
jgi:hypothetical protein